jgi:two-component system, NtrC family, response regulator GlrR
MSRRDGTKPPSEPPTEADGSTLTHPNQGVGFGAKAIRRFRLLVLEGPDKGTPWASTLDKCEIGSIDYNDLVLHDNTVSKKHCEIRIDSKGAHILDLGSHNGTIVDGVEVVEASLRSGSVIRLGKTVLQFDFELQGSRLPVSEDTSFGSLLGTSVEMRSVFALLARVAEKDTNVLLEGETGTGKTQAARSIHEKSARKDGPFVTFDCGAAHGNTLESTLFGHEKGAYTGAVGSRIGILEEASGGTIFLDEIGELPKDLQPKLLRALDERKIRRLGGSKDIHVDVRVIAATKRDLRAEMNAERFRDDLYYRITAVRIVMPPLRQRPEDIPMILDKILASLSVSAEERAELSSAEVIARLQRGAWPGNVRELENWVQRYLAIGEPPMAEHEQTGLSVDHTLPYAEAKGVAINDFERRYFETLMRLHKRNVAQVADAAGMDRTSVYRVLKRCGLLP